MSSRVLLQLAFVLHSSGPRTLPLGRCFLLPSCPPHVAFCFKPSICLPSCTAGCQLVAFFLRELDIGDEVPESTWKVLKKRRLLPGALTSFDDFANLFQSLADVNVEFQGQPAEPVSNFDTILHVVQKYQDNIGALYPRFSKHMVRLAS